MLDGAGLGKPDEGGPRKGLVGRREQFDDVRAGCPYAEGPGSSRRVANGLRSERAGFYRKTRQVSTPLKGFR
jgi:hypothetical protein